MRGNKVEVPTFLYFVGNGAGNRSEEVTMRSKLLMMSTAALLVGTLAAAGQSIQPGGAAQDKDKGQQGSSQGVKPNEGVREQTPKAGTQGQVQRDQDKQLKGQAQSDQDKKGQTQGQAQSDQDKQKSQTKGQAERDQDKRKGQTQGQAERDQDKQKGQTQVQDKQKSQTQGQAPRDQDRQQGQAPRDQDRQGQQGEREGQRSGNVSVTLTTEQRTKIRETVFKSSNAPRVSNVNFSLNVGTPVPRTVHVVDVPEVIVEVHPEWRGYRYFIVNDELVIVEPDTLRIVAIIDV
jgi:hypothetical protein